MMVGDDGGVSIMRSVLEGRGLFVEVEVSLENGLYLDFFGRIGERVTFFLVAEVGVIIC